MLLHSFVWLRLLLSQTSADLLVEALSLAFVLLVVVALLAVRLLVFAVVLWSGLLSDNPADCRLIVALRLVRLEASE